LIYYIKILIYLLAVVLAVAAGIYNWKQLDKAARVFVVLLGVTLGNEISSIINAYATGNNMPLYHAFAVVQLTFIVAYFLHLHQIFTTGRLVVAAGVATGAAVLNVINFQPLDGINSNFLMLESIIIIIMSIISLYRIIDDERIEWPSRNVHFRIWLFLLILWSSTFFWWGLYTYIEQNKELRNIANYIRVVLNIIIYAGIGIALLKLPKHEHSKQ
jgi:hypothetical protein